MTMNRQGRPTGVPEAATGGDTAAGPATFTGHKALERDEGLIFEIGSPAVTGVDLEDPGDFETALGGFERTEPMGLTGLSEPHVVRHYTRLSQKNYGIDTGLFPLGSCTMKHNPRLNEKIARLPGFADIHPMQPERTVQGALEVIDTLADWLRKLTNMAAIAMSPKAGAHGELCGMMAIRAALEHRGEQRRTVLVPESAHGTNPATAVFCGFQVKTLASTEDGRVDVAALKAQLGPDVAAIMLTNPNTCGLFETDIQEIAALVHEAGGYFYCDGANFNALIGKVRPGDLGIDAMHFNLHKTCSTPHGGGGPGSGPTVLSEALAPFAPVPWVEKAVGGGLRLKATVRDGNTAFGRMTAFHGQMGMFTRALAYLMSHGRDGLRLVAEDAVLNANYVAAGLDKAMTRTYKARPMHEVLFDDRFLKGTGVDTLGFAKALIDEGFHPMTMYFPLVASGAMLIEPTETESRRSLDEFVFAMTKLAEAAKAGETERFDQAPRFAPLRRLDETAAARKPVLRYEPPAPYAQAAE
ncbi:glycine dehydrogenase (aminomethyl-transferring) [Rhodothalassium salexigens]|uniref:aminomethyl-transferring glycine dehydrogenase subunit GcvPB n=1 Tax=Rhodothalassium salexigens TaxID=1086 RepID=UPI0019141628|nr:aminomethyl-transferring glycine dehydrogenase subunit GcvPB [Rhodothalassium salexigens]MBK5912014.1 glycine dehydrogenase (aminomethyl-transferring) [Rhodothalassium salexigens]